MFICFSSIFMTPAHQCTSQQLTVCCSILITSSCDLSSSSSYFRLTSSIWWSRSSKISRFRYVCAHTHTWKEVCDKLWFRSGMYTHHNFTIEKMCMHYVSISLITSLVLILMNKINYCITGIMCFGCWKKQAAYITSIYDLAGTNG